jgi:hypothetical protein
MPLSANEDSSDEEHDDIHLGGKHVVIKRIEVPPSSNSTHPLELRSLTLWAPGTCPRQREQCIAGIGVSRNTAVKFLKQKVCSGFASKWL